MAWPQKVFCGVWLSGEKRIYKSDKTIRNELHFVDIDFMKLKGNVQQSQDCCQYIIRTMSVYILLDKKGLE